MSQNTQGIKLLYGVETSAGTKPTTGFVQIPGITEIPEISSAPDTLEDTTLDNQEYKTYIDGLKDTGGTMAFTANDTPEFRTAIKTLMSAYETAKAAGKATWFRISVPSPISEDMDFTGNPQPLGFGGASINSVLTTTFNIVVTGEPSWSSAGE